MPRRNNKGRIKLQYRMGFKRMTKQLGLNPIQRVKIAKYISEITKEVDLEK
jgi:hypothetical protein